MTIAADAYVKKLMKRGWEYFDEGEYSVVLHHADFPYLVRKVTHSKDDPYVHFIRWSVKNPDTHLPKVLAMFDDPKFFAVDLERLEPMDESSDREQDILYYLDNALSGCDIKDIKHVPETLRKTANMLFSEFRHKYVNDIHEANIMYRGDVPIITDPYCARIK